MKFVEPARVLYVSNRPYTNKNGEQKVFTEVTLRFEQGGQVFKLQASGHVNSAIENQDCNVEFELRQFKESVGIRVTAVEPVK